MSETVFLKKYANRRLYNTEESKYVTLEQVAGMVKKGRNIKVVDVKTKEDVTAYVLTQIVMEEAKNNNTLLPVPLLYLLIQYGDNLLVEFFEVYLQQAIQTFLNYKASFDNQFKKWLTLGADITDITQRSMPGIPSLKSFLDISSSQDKQKKKS
ncbi:MAG: polyhydroxyalkanoate synthesis regulator DNA-binding domain-containing protein [Desulfosarcina sp.]|nr:polyhydroxyalkanoate synthesis regulator DNA-binding domain-containing protein [Desulfobacterales bacterium]